MCFSPHRDESNVKSGIKKPGSVVVVGQPGNDNPMDGK